MSSPNSSKTAPTSPRNRNPWIVVGPRAPRAASAPPAPCPSDPLTYICSVPSPPAPPPSSPTGPRDPNRTHFRTEPSPPLNRVTKASLPPSRVIRGTFPIRFITLNVRYATDHLVPNEEPWTKRLPHLAAQLHFLTVNHRSTFICLQEALAHQLNDIKTALNEAQPTSSSDYGTWAHIGVGRDDGQAAGEFSPVLYRNDKWSVVRSETCWLSPTPTEPGRGWDAAQPRIVTMGLFRRHGTSIRSGRRVLVMGTHFDDQGVQARKESARLILQFADEWVEEEISAYWNERTRPAVFLGGDFNSTPSDEAYLTMTAPGTGMVDVRETVPEERRYGNELTYTSFGEDAPQRIDFLFVKDPTGMEFRTFGVLANRFDDGVFLSDHRAVVADVKMPL